MTRVGSGANFVRYTLGDVAVVALRDGYVDMPPSRLRQEDGQPFGTALPKQVAVVGGKLRLSVNAFLVTDENGPILIDTGAADAWDPTLGLLLSALAEAGVAREQIRTVALTHTHIDHVSGLLAAGGARAFPNLERLFVPRKEIESFQQKQHFAQFHRQCIALGNGHRLTSRLTAIAAHGHEAGHTAFEVMAAGERMLVWGDTVHVPSIQFARPDLTWEFDADQPQARLTRKRMLSRAAQAGTCVAGAHLDFPGVGVVSCTGENFAFTPL